MKFVSTSFHGQEIIKQLTKRKIDVQHSRLKYYRVYKSKKSKYNS